jgi:hypothetical protein
MVLMTLKKCRNNHCGWSFILTKFAFLSSRTWIRERSLCRRNRRKNKKLFGSRSCSRCYVGSYCTISIRWTWKLFHQVSEEVGYQSTSDGPTLTVCAKISDTTPLIERQFSSHHWMKASLSEIQEAIQNFRSRPSEYKKFCIRGVCWLLCVCWLQCAEPWNPRLHRPPFGHNCLLSCEPQMLNLLHSRCVHTPTLVCQGRENDDKSQSFKTAQNIFDSKSFASNCA